MAMLWIALACICGSIALMAWALVHGGTRYDTPKPPIVAKAFYGVTNAAMGDNARKDLPHYRRSF